MDDAELSQRMRAFLDRVDLVDREMEALQEYTVRGDPESVAPMVALLHQQVQAMCDLLGDTISYVVEHRFGPVWGDDETR